MYHIRLDQVQEQQGLGSSLAAYIHVLHLGLGGSDMGRTNVTPSSPILDPLES